MTYPDVQSPVKSVPEIVATYARRRVERSDVLERCRRITDAYNNAIVLPLPEVSASEAPAVANLLGSGIDQHAMRIASVLPDVQCPPVTIGNRASQRRADTRRRACLGFWEGNSYELLMRRRARSLIAYTQAPVWLRPNQGTKQPCWEVRSPLETYPSALESTEMRPEDCIFAFTRTFGWLRRSYPEMNLSSIQIPSSQYAPRRSVKDTDAIDIVHYLDDNEQVLLAVGEGECADIPKEAEYGIQDARIINLGPAGGNGPAMWAALLRRIPNRLGECPVVIPGRITLAQLKGQFDDSIGLYQMQAQLMAMEVNAIANGIWPDQWMISAPGQQGKIVTHADGRRGTIGEITGGTLETTQVQPGLQTPGTIDRLERGIRLSAAIPADFSGEAASNVRTAVRGQAILAEAVDYTIQEHQQILARSMQHELEIASQIDLTYFGSSKKSFYVSWKGGKGRLDYVPRDIWSEDRTIRVNYAKAGSDIGALAVEIGQRVGIGTLSKYTGMQMDPMVQDPEFEHNQVVYEGLEQAQLSSLQQAAVAGQLGPADLARIMQRVHTDEADLPTAVLDQQKEAQARQSATVEPAMPGSPETQPGIAAPGAGAEAGTAIEPPGPSQQNLSQLLRAVTTAGRSQSTAAAAS